MGKRRIQVCAFTKHRCQNPAERIAGTSGVHGGNCRSTNFNDPVAINRPGATGPQGRDNDCIGRRCQVSQRLLRIALSRTHGAGQHDGFQLIHDQIIEFRQISYIDRPIGCYR